MNGRFGQMLGGFDRNVLQCVHTTVLLI
jgi:hypothetical protein